MVSKSTTMKADHYLKMFFAEKQIPYEQFEIESGNNIHLIDTNFIIEAVLSTTTNEQTAIANMLRKLDFYNQPINPYLKFLAKALVSTHYTE
jgi:hypothetical protein